MPWRDTSWRRKEERGRWQLEESWLSPGWPFLGEEIPSCLNLIIIITKPRLAILQLSLATPPFRSSSILTKMNLIREHFLWAPFKRAPFEPFNSGSSFDFIRELVQKTHNLTKLFVINSPIKSYLVAITFFLVIIKLCFSVKWKHDWE